MSPLTPVTDSTAPEASRATLTSVQKAWGVVPNLICTFANSLPVVGGWRWSSVSPPRRR